MDKEIRIDDLCLDVAKAGASVQMVKCHHLKGNQMWEFNEQVKYISSYVMKLCYEVWLIIDIINKKLLVLSLFLRLADNFTQTFRQGNWFIHQPNNA